MHSASDRARIQVNAEVMRGLASLTRDLRKCSHSLDDVLDRITGAATSLIPGADHACLVLGGKNPSVRQGTDSVAEQLTRDQYVLDEGPLARGTAHLDSVVVADLQTDARWPALADRALACNARAFAVFRLFTDSGDLGSIVVYSRRLASFEPGAVAIGESLAAHGAVAMVSAQDIKDFRGGLTHRDIIGQAKGMLMERYDIDADRAFDLLTTLSQTGNRRLHEVASQLVEIDHPRQAASKA